MKIIINKTVEEKVELILPAYFKNTAHVYKISKDETCIQVCTVNEYLSIAKCHNTLPLNTNAELTTEKLYTQEYKKVLQMLKIENLKK